MKEFLSLLSLLFLFENVQAAEKLEATPLLAQKSPQKEKPTYENLYKEIKKELEWQTQKCASIIEALVEEQRHILHIIRDQASTPQNIIEARSAYAKGDDALTDLYVIRRGMLKQDPNVDVFGFLKKALQANEQQNKSG